MQAGLMQGCSAPEVDGIWLWVQYNRIPIYSIFYLLKRDYMVIGCRGLYIYQLHSGAPVEVAYSIVIQGA